MVRAVRFRSERKSTRQYSTATGSHPLLTQYQVPTYALELEELSGHGLWFDGACGPLGGASLVRRHLVRRRLVRRHLMRRHLMRRHLVRRHLVPGGTLRHGCNQGFLGIHEGLDAFAGQLRKRNGRERLEIRRASWRERGEVFV